jgi:hypothetical protein
MPARQTTNEHWPPRPGLSDPNAGHFPGQSSFSGSQGHPGGGYPGGGNVAVAAPPARSIVPLLVAAAIGGAVSLAIGSYGRLHTPTGGAVATFGFPSVLPMKAWFATGAALLALVQLLSALWMWGRIPGAGRARSWVATAHRWTGTVAFLLTLPVAYHCLWALGFQDTDARVLTHSILGCAFYGAFTTKMLVLRSAKVPGWAVPALGGALVALLAGLWFTSSLWFYTNIGFTGV